MCGRTTEESSDTVLPQTVRQGLEAAPRVLSLGLQGPFTTLLQSEVSTSTPTDDSQRCSPQAFVDPNGKAESVVIGSIQVVPSI